MNFSDAAINLTPNTLYYFRAVVENKNGTAYGNTLSFRTGTVYVPPSIPTPTPTPTPEPGFRAASIEKEVSGLCEASCHVSAKEATVLSGNIVQYEIRIKNTGTLSLRDARIEDILPEALMFSFASDNGEYNKDRRKVTWNIDRIDPEQTRAVTVTTTATRVTENVTIRNSAIVEAGTVFEESNEVTVHITTADGSQSGDGAASVFTSVSFWPETLIGWLLLLILLLVLIYAALYVLDKVKAQKKPQEPQVP